jgi:2'-5' RNA ligase
MAAPESALVVLVPEAEALVKPFREAHDPSAAAGVPAHITTLYPFKAPETIDAAVIEGVQARFARLAPFEFRLHAIRRFPGVLYLAPENPGPFRALTRTVWNQHPETPPYGGKHPNIMPHLTVAQIPDETSLDRVAEEFESIARHALPIRARATGSRCWITSPGAGRSGRACVSAPDPQIEPGSTRPTVMAASDRTKPQNRPAIIPSSSGQRFG